MVKIQFENLELEYDFESFSIEDYFKFNDLKGIEQQKELYEMVKRLCKTPNIDFKKWTPKRIFALGRKIQDQIVKEMSDSGEPTKQ